MNDQETISSASLRWDRALTLISGYHEQSYPPRAAYQAGLRRRFAIVMRSDCKNNPDRSFDVELFLALGRAVQASLDFDSQIIKLDNDLTASSLDELAEFYARIEAIEHEAPHKISYYRDARLVCEEETEFWNLVGGPFLYHDSRTFSFYTGEDRFEEFVARCAAACAQFGVEAPMRYWGQDFKKPLPWYQWPLRWLLG